MEAWENKLIADKLNSLQDLPEGYAPNIASKWEIIQSGLQSNRRRIHAGWWIAFCFILITGLMIWIFSEKEPTHQVTNITEQNQTVPAPTIRTQPLVQPTKTPPTLKEKERKEMAKTQEVSGRPKFKPAIIQSSIRPADSVIQIRTDTINISAPFAELKTPKQKRKTFQKDFEGFASRTDTVQQKTASKGLQFKWRSPEEKTMSSEEPKFRLIQKF